MKTNNKLNPSNITMIIFISFLVFDFLIFLLSGFGFYFSFIKQTNNIAAILLTLLSFYAMAFSHKLERILVFIVTFIAIIILTWFYLSNNSYSTIESPNGNIKVTVGHRNVTLGETNHFYNIYLHTSIPFVMKRVNEETINIQTRGSSLSNLEVLGTQDVEWKDEEVVFHSPEVGEIQVDLKP